ncbi:MAG TPA: TIR domain-containing protein [Nitrospira sp.]|nr:TIR domain-containing protein [Nitrospira sp.]
MNIVYLVSPELTLRTSPQAAAFSEAIDHTLRDFITVSVLHTSSQLLTTDPDVGDAVVVFNREDQDYLERLKQFLARSLRTGAKVFPVAISVAARRPPAEAGTAQSFDLPEQLRQRALAPSQTETIAKVFARQLLSILTPTLVTEPMHLFLSHRRFDGEDLTAAFTRLRSTSTDRSFRDLYDVRMGEDAQEVIESRLGESDAVIFLDTPRAGESPWIAKELRMALEFGIPIVWVRIGPEDGRIPLELKPAAEPHFRLPDTDPRSQEIPIDIVEQIVHEAARIHHRDYVDRLFSEFLRLRDIAAAHHSELKQIDSRRMVYCLVLQRPAGRYKQRPLKHLLQLFGRIPTRQDVMEFAGCAEACGYQAHPSHGFPYDTAILLAATPPKSAALVSDGGVHTDSIHDYVAEIERATSPQQHRSKRIVLSGAFPDCEPEFQQNLTAALHAVAEGALRSGVGLSFGAHPTFQFMLFDLAKRLRPDDYRAVLRMYVSRHFVTDAAVREFEKSAQVVATEDVERDRAKSLTLMRRAMIQDPDAGALVAIGGKTARGGHVPGIDEEISIARERGLPIFILGSVGGRSSEIIGEMTPRERVALNGQSEAVNEAFAKDIDYSRLAHLILQAVR